MVIITLFDVYKNVAKVSDFNNVKCILLNALLLMGFEKQPARQSYAHLKIKTDFLF